VKNSPQARAAALAGLNEWDPAARRRGFLALCLLPALVVLVLVLVYPLFYNVLLSFSDASIHRIRGWKFAGLSQYLLVFREPEFWITFSKTIIWTVVTTSLQVAVGVFLALMLHQQFVRGASAWRVLLLLPWAMPQYITALTWRGMFHGDQGPVNAFLAATFGLAPVEWLASPVPAFTAAILVNVWMGFPFMMVVALAGLRGIPPSVYEAATLDGASTWRQFTRLTAPLLRPVMLPATTLGIIWNFNNLNVIWLFSNGGEPGDSTQILVSYVYKAAFTYYRFGWAAALSVVIFVILFLAVQTFLQVNRWKR
jgi:arabinogalactan oligomer / maltooligosaccharide transport system permease protein